MIGRFLLLTLLLFPVAEILAFFAVASAIGLLRALALFFGTSLLGLLILRGGGLARIIQLGRAGLDRATMIELQAANAVLLLAGTLLLLPGFISDAVGLALLLAPRVWARAILSRLFGPRRRNPERPDIVDLDPADWRQVPDKQIPKRRDPTGRNRS